MQPMESVETVTNLKGLMSLGSGLAITVIVCYVLVKYVLPFFERQINNTLQIHKDSLNAIISSYDKFIGKIADNMEKGMTSLANDIKELRNELRYHSDTKDKRGEK